MYPMEQKDRYYVSLRFEVLGIYWVLSLLFFFSFSFSLYPFRFPLI